jgi:hypothetical protein
MTYYEHNARTQLLRPSDFIEPDETLTGNYQVTEEGFDTEMEMFERVLERMREHK